MAVSSRSVGFAELFAMAEAQRPNDSPVQRVAVEPEAPTEIAVQTAAAEASSAVQPSSAAPAAGTSGAPTGAELEEMARRLYEPLSSRLRAELWQDRERSGLLTDLRP